MLANYEFHQGMHYKQGQNVGAVRKYLREEEMFEGAGVGGKPRSVYPDFPFLALQHHSQSHKELWYKAPIAFLGKRVVVIIRGIIDHLDHICGTAIDVVYLTPIFKSDSCRKYDTSHYYQIDPSFGTTEDLKELVQKAVARGMKVVLWMAVVQFYRKRFFCI